MKNNTKQFIAISAVLIVVTAIFSALTFSASADTGWNRQQSSSDTVKKGWMCDRGITCSSVYHTRRGVSRRILVSCGNKDAPEANKRLPKGVSSNAPGKCAKRVNAVYVPPGLDLAYCSNFLGSGLVCYTWRGDTGWYYLKDYQHPKLHLVHNGVCNERCSPDAS